MAVLRQYMAVLRQYMAVLRQYMAVLRLYMAVLRQYMAVLRQYMAERFSVCTHVHNDTSLKQLFFSVVELEVVLAVALVGVLPAHLASSNMD
jgi:hypothetical protein